MDFSNEELKATRMSAAEREVVEKIEYELQHHSSTMGRSEKSAKEDELAFYYYISRPRQPAADIGPCKAHQELAKQQLKWLEAELQKSTSVTSSCPISLHFTMLDLTDQNSN